LSSERSKNSGSCSSAPDCGAGLTDSGSSLRFFLPLTVPPQFDYGDPVTYAFDRDELTFPEVVIDDYNCDLAEIMKPLFDTIANAAGWACSQSYNAEGNSVLRCE
jgi:hypothetical protein